MTLDIRPVTPDGWNDLVALFGPRGAVAAGACGRLSAKEWESKAYEGNRRGMKKLVDAGDRPGLLAYRNGVPVGWVSVAPREQFPRIERSRVLGPVDGAKVWSVVCFFIDRKERGSGVGSALLDGRGRGQPSAARRSWRATRSIRAARRRRTGWRFHRPRADVPRRRLRGGRAPQPRAADHA